MVLLRKCKTLPIAEPIVQLSCLWFPRPVVLLYYRQHPSALTVGAYFAASTATTLHAGTEDSISQLKEKNTNSSSFAPEE